MDAVSAGASVLAFVGLCVQAAKVIHTVLSGVKDGPQNVQQATTDVYGLYLTLVQLSKCRVLDESGGEALKSRLLACFGDIETFADKLEKLTIDDSEGSRGKYWKRIKAILNEKSLANMSAVVVSHTSALNLQLTAIQSDTVFGISDQLRGISRELAAGQTLRGAQVTVWDEQKVVLGAVLENTTNIRDNHATIREEMQAVYSISTTRADETHQMLKEILQQVVRLSLQSQEPRKAVEVQDQSPGKSPIAQEIDLNEGQPCWELMETITRLCDLVRDKQGRTTPSEAKDLIEGLLAALRFMMSREFLEAAVASGLVGKEFCPTCHKRHLGDLQTGLTAVYSALLSAQQITLNEAGQTYRPTTGTNCRSSWRVLTYDIAVGSLSITVCTRSWNLNSQQMSYDSSPAGIGDLMAGDQEEVTTSVSLIHTLSQVKRMLKLTSRQYHGYHGAFSTIPRLFVNNILPANSPVFSVVRQGRMDEFQALLREGKASLRDHDEYGASLLMYANVQPDICRFLIQSGADVNHVAKHIGVSGWNQTASALFKHVNDHEAEEELQSILACRKYLLEAGCDPTTPAVDHDRGDSHNFYFFAETFDEGVPVRQL